MFVILFFFYMKIIVIRGGMKMIEFIKKFVVIENLYFYYLNIIKLFGMREISLLDYMFFI